MNRAQQVRAVYAELRHALGPAVPARMLLRCAAEIVAQHHALSAPVTDPAPRPSRSFVSVPLDLAFRDGGWRVLEHERAGLAVASDDAWSPQRHPPRLARILGLAA